MSRLPTRRGRGAPADSRAAGPSASPDPELVAQRDRLIERFAVMQSELGGLFYEMAIRDHVRMNILIQKAAELQRVEAELNALQQLIKPAAPESAA